MRRRALPPDLRWCYTESMSLGLQYQKYLDWLEDRGQIYPYPRTNTGQADRKVFKVILVHGITENTGLSADQAQLLSRIATACGFEPEHTMIDSAMTVEREGAGLNFVDVELVVTFGDAASQAWTRVTQRAAFDEGPVIKGPAIEVLEASPAEKRNLWKKLQTRKGLIKTIR